MALNDVGGDGIGMLPRATAPTSGLVPGMAAPLTTALHTTVQALGAPYNGDTSGPGPNAASEPVVWRYVFDVPSGQWQAEYDGVVIAPNLVPPTGFAPLNSPHFTGVPTTPDPPVGDNSTQIANTEWTNAAIAAAVAIAPKPGVIGLGMSTPGSSANMTVAAGSAASSTFANQITLAAAITKTTAAWAVGSGVGGLDTGAIANNTWYHWFVIRRPDTGVCDVLFSTSPTAPTLPANYTQFRRIGSMETDGSAHWRSFVQDGGWFAWGTPVNDVQQTNPGIVAVTRTISVPTGVRVRAWCNCAVVDTTATTAGQTMFSQYLSDLSQPDVNNNGSTTVFSAFVVSGATSSGFQYGGIDFVMTNTSAQVRSRCNPTSTAATTFDITTRGWFDFRGENGAP